MDQKPMDMESVQVMIPGEEYEKRLYRLVVALLEFLEKNEIKDEDIKVAEVAK